MSVSLMTTQELLGLFELDDAGKLCSFVPGRDAGWKIRGGRNDRL